MRRKTAWLFSGGRSTRFIRTSTISIPNSREFSVAIVVLLRISAARSLVRISDRGNITQNLPERGVDDVRQARFHAGDRAHCLEEQQRIDDPVPSKRVYDQLFLIDRWDFLGIPVEAQKPFIEIGCRIDERDFDVQAGFGNNAGRFTEATHQNLFGFIDREEGGRSDHKSRSQNDEG